MSENRLIRSKKAKYKIDNGESHEITHRIPKSVEIGSAGYFWKLVGGGKELRLKNENWLKVYLRSSYTQISNCTFRIYPLRTVKWRVFEPGTQAILVTVEPPVFFLRTSKLDCLPPGRVWENLL